MDEETEAGFDLEETDVDLELPVQGDDPFAGLIEDAGAEKGQEDASSNSPGGSVAEPESDELDDLELSLTGSEAGGSDDTLSATLSGDSAIDNLDQDEGSDLDAMLSEFGNGSDGENSGSEVDGASQEPKLQVAPGQPAAEEDNSFDLDAEFAGLVGEDAEKPTQEAKEDTDLDDAFAAFTSQTEVEEPKTAGEGDDEALDAMLADLTVDEESPLAAEHKVDPKQDSSQEAAPVEENPKEVIDGDLEAELDDLLKEFGDL